MMLQRNISHLDAFRSHLSALQTVSDIEATYDALKTLESVAEALACQPRAFNSKFGDRTPSGDVLISLRDLLGHEISGLVDAIKVINPADPHERQSRESVIIAHELSCGAAASEIAELSASLARG